MTQARYYVTLHITGAAIFFIISLASWETSSLIGG